MLNASKILLLLMALVVSVKAESSIEIDVGTALSKSILGVSYTSGKNQINVGLKEFWIQPSSGFRLDPGIGYNRGLTDNGFYANLSFAPTYENYETTRWRLLPSDSSGYSPQSVRIKGWSMGNLLLGAGKSFQFTRWGIHLDAGFATPATSDFARAWGYWIGAGGSYRFKLD